MTKSSQIDTFNLFGETAELADVLHVETIQSRSRLHNWELKPHRHARLHQVLFLTSGGGTAELDGSTEPLHPPCLVNAPSGVVHGFRFAPDTTGWVVTLTSDLLDHCLAAGEGVQVPLQQPAVLPFGDELARVAPRIHQEYQATGFARAQILRGLAGILTALVARAIHASASVAQPGDDNPLFKRFQTMVERDFRRRRSLADYAADLAISPTHLNRIVHQATGHSASRLLGDRVLREARRLLIYTNLSAAEIAYELGFNDPAHFSRVFSGGTGQPPGVFRAQFNRRT